VQKEKLALYTWNVTKQKIEKGKVGFAKSPKVKLTETQNKTHQQLIYFSLFPA